MAKLPKVLGRFLNWLEEPAQPPPPEEPSLLEQLMRHGQTSGEKRATARNQLQITADLVDSIRGLPSKVTVENVSDQGVFFVSNTSFPLGSVVELRIVLPSGGNHEARRVNLLVRIVRVERKDDGHYGIAAQIMRCRTVEDQPSTEPRNLQ